MNSKKYWEKRTAREAYEMYEDAEKVAGELKKAYSGASAYLQRQAEGLFEKFRQKYGLSDAEARRLLNSLHDSTSINELMQKLRTCEQTDDIKELRKHIEAAAYGARLRRMAGIQDSIDRLMKRLFGKTVKLASDWLQRLAGESYYKHMFELCKRTGFLLKFNGLSERAIMKLLKTKWLGSDFSSRLWENTKRLAEKLKEELLVSMLTGRTDRETANVINDEFRKGASAARRLVRTESNHVYTEARFIGTEECGLEEYIFLATLDLRTSKICRSLDGKRFKVKDRKVGTNCPPMHPWCRSTTLDYFGEEWLKNGTRSALDPVTGKRIKVPLSMTYKEWYEKYVKGHEKEIQEKENEPKNRNLTREQYDRYRRRGVSPDSYEEFIKLKGDPEAWAKLQEEYRKAKEVPKKSKKKKAAQPKVEDKAAEVHVKPEKVEGNVYKDQKVQDTIDSKTEEKLQVSSETSLEEDKSTGEDKPFEDITDEWNQNLEKNEGSISLDDHYTAPDGTRYDVDDRNVLQRHTQEEKDFAKEISKALGKPVKMTPEVVGEHKRVKTPDFVTDDELRERWDAKAISAKGKDPLRNEMSSKKAENYAFDISKREAELETIIAHAEFVFYAYNTTYVRIVALYDNGVFVKVLRRK